MKNRRAPGSSPRRRVTRWCHAAGACGCLAFRPESGQNILTMSRKPATSDIGATDFKARCLELIDHVRDAGAEYIVTRHGTPVARLVPVEASEPASPLGSMRGTVLDYDRPFEPVPGAWTLDEPMEG